MPSIESWQYVQLRRESKMPITINRVGRLYEAEVTPPHGRGQHWRSPEPMEIDDLITALTERGCHQADVGDAFFEADPEWEIRS